jgi:hypothetical protein
VMFESSPPNNDDGMLKMATPIGTNAPAATVRHVRLKPLNLLAVLAFGRLTASPLP